MMKLRKETIIKTLASILAVVMLLTLTACESEQPSANSSILPENSLSAHPKTEAESSQAAIDNCNKVIITWFADTREYSSGMADNNSVEIVDAEKIDEIIFRHQSLDYTETSRPMSFPRYYIQFICDEIIVADLYIAPTNVKTATFIISGSELGPGNKELKSSVVLELIDELYQNP